MLLWTLQMDSDKLKSRESLTLSALSNLIDLSCWFFCLLIKHSLCFWVFALTLAVYCWSTLWGISHLTQAEGKTLPLSGNVSLRVCLFLFLWFMERPDTLLDIYCRCSRTHSCLCCCVLERVRQLILGTVQDMSNKKMYVLETVRRFQACILGHYVNH